MTIIYYKKGDVHQICYRTHLMGVDWFAWSWRKIDRCHQISSPLRSRDPFLKFKLLVISRFLGQLWNRLLELAFPFAAVFLAFWSPDRKKSPKKALRNDLFKNGPYLCNFSFEKFWLWLVEFLLRSTKKRDNKGFRAAKKSKHVTSSNVFRRKLDPLTG